MMGKRKITSCVEVLSHPGADLLYGKAEDEIPLL